MKTQLNSTNIKMKVQMKSTRQIHLLAALFLSLTMLVTSYTEQGAAPNASAQSNEPVQAKPFAGQIFRTADDRQVITLVSQDELEMRGRDTGPDNLICKYTRQDDTLRVVKTMLGTTVAVYYKIIPEGLKANDGTVLFNTAWFKAESLFKSGNEKMFKDKDGAIADYNRAIELNPKLVFAYNNRGCVKKAKGDYDGAIADFGRVLELAPKYVGAYTNRGGAKLMKGDYDGAIADYTRAIELDPKDASAYYCRGGAKGEKGDLDGAIADFDRSLELDPKDAFAYNGRGKTYMLKGDYERAIQDCSRSIELNDKNSFAYYNRGWAYCKKRDYDRAWADVKKCRELGGKVDTKFLAELTKASGRTE